MVKVHINKDGGDTIFYTKTAGVQTEILRLSPAGEVTGQGIYINQNAGDSIFYAKIAGVPTQVMKISSSGVVTAKGDNITQINAANISVGVLPVARGGTGGTLPVANGGTGVTSSTGSGNVVLSSSPSLASPSMSNPSFTVGGQSGNLVRSIAFGGLFGGTGTTQHNLNIGFNGGATVIGVTGANGGNNFCFINSFGMGGWGDLGGWNYVSVVIQNPHNASNTSDNTVRVWFIV